MQNTTVFFLHIHFTVFQSKTISLNTCVEKKKNLDKLAPYHFHSAREHYSGGLHNPSDKAAMKILSTLKLFTACQYMSMGIGVVHYSVYVSRFWSNTSMFFHLRFKTHLSYRTLFHCKNKQYEANTTTSLCKTKNNCIITVSPLVFFLKQTTKQNAKHTRNPPGVSFPSLRLTGNGDRLKVGNTANVNLIWLEELPFLFSTRASYDFEHLIL